MPNASHHRRSTVMRMLRRGQITITEAAQLALVSRQRVRVWCRTAGIDPKVVRAGMVAELFAKLNRQDED